MPTTVDALSVAHAGAPLAPVTITRRDPGPTEVVIDIAYVGVCHSDLHFARDDWGISTFPLVPGHEITGVVSGVGAGVTRHRIGDRVGVGIVSDSCRECASCTAGMEQFCLRGNVGTFNSVGRDGLPTAGGFSRTIVVEEDFTVRVPDGLALDAAAPLLCAGVTMFSALRHWRAGPGTRVAIVGLGGLGHLGVRLAAAMGAEVSVLSRSRRKEPDARRLGAAHFHDADSRDGLAATFDLIISTLSTSPDTAPLLAMLAVDGTLVMAGAPAQPLTAPVGLLIGGRRGLAGTSVGGLAETREMLDFCAAHGIAADVEVIAADRADEAFTRLESADDIRYRLVIDASTI